mmetsp:Transcript_22918/g.59891  ORF Transcript_22918/g.59891 Transcript_22918/m.59891 type:complete len:211 (+) Transcript_22918:980-1612(+)
MPSVPSTLFRGNCSTSTTFSTVAATPCGPPPADSGHDISAVQWRSRSTVSSMLREASEVMILEPSPSSAAAARSPSNRASRPAGDTSMRPPLPSAPLQKLDTASATRAEPKPACTAAMYGSEPGPYAISADTNCRGPSMRPVRQGGPSTGWKAGPSGPLLPPPARGQCRNRRPRQARRAGVSSSGGGGVGEEVGEEGEMPPAAVELPVPR